MLRNQVKCKKIAIFISAIIIIKEIFIFQYINKPKSPNMDQQYNKVLHKYEVQLMAKITNQMAQFFNQITKICMNSCNKSQGRLISSEKQGTTADINIKNSPTIVLAENSNNLIKGIQKEENKQKKSIELEISVTSQMSVDKKYENKIVGPKYKYNKKKQLKKDSLEVTHKPKAPTSSFLLFLHDYKKQMSQQTNIPKFSKIAANYWKDLPQSDKEKYIKQSEIQKVRYQEEMKEYKKKYPEQIIQLKKQKQIKYRQNLAQRKKKNQIMQNTPKKVARDISQYKSIESLSSNSSSQSSSISSDSSSTSKDEKSNKNGSMKRQGKDKADIISLDHSFKSNSEEFIL